MDGPVGERRLERCIDEAVLVDEREPVEPVRRDRYLEVIASARARGLRVDELGIPTHYGDEKSYLNPIWYGLRCLRVMLRYRLGRYAA